MKGKKVAIVQSNYIPWKGYFDLIDSVDEFILLDEVQFTRRDWRNRNRIKTKDGLQWLTIPVESKSGVRQKVSATRVANREWAAKHLTRIRHTYTRAEHFREYEDLLEELYGNCTSSNLSHINARFIRTLCSVLDIDTKITQSSAYRVSSGKTDRLLDLCKQAGAETYVSGPAARSYLDERLFERERISVVWFDYTGYPEYPQLYPPFEHKVSVIDLLFSVGREKVRRYLGKN